MVCTSCRELRTSCFVLKVNERRMCCVLCTTTVVATFVVWVTVTELTPSISANINVPWFPRTVGSFGVYVTANVAYSIALCMDGVKRSVPLREIAVVLQPVVQESECHTLRSSSHTPYEFPCRAPSTSYTLVSGLGESSRCTERSALVLGATTVGPTVTGLHSRATFLAKS